MINRSRSLTIRVSFSFASWCLDPSNILDEAPRVCLRFTHGIRMNIAHANPRLPNKHLHCRSKSNNIIKKQVLDASSIERKNSCENICRSLRHFHQPMLDRQLRFSISSCTNLSHLSFLASTIPPCNKRRPARRLMDKGKLKLKFYMVSSSLVTTVTCQRRLTRILRQRVN